MDVVVLSVVCAAGLAIAAVFALRWGGLRTDYQRQAPETSELGGGQMVLRYLRMLAIVVVAGATSGILVLGFGGRLVMRILAATSGDRAQGAITEAEETVGQITFGGSFGFVVFIGIFGGALGAFVYVVLRHWLPSTAWAAGLVVGVLGFGFARLDPLDPENVDFELLRPDWLGVVLLGLLPFFFGVVVVSLVERLNRSYPMLAWRPLPVLAHVPLLLILSAPPIAAGLIVGLVVAWLSPRLVEVRRVWSGPAVLRSGQALVGVIAGMAIFFGGAGIAGILG